MPRFALYASLLLLAQPCWGQMPQQQDGSQLIEDLDDATNAAELERYKAAHPPSDPIDEARYEIAALRLGACEPRLPRQQREDFVRRALDRRDHLIRGHPNDPRRAVWLADQAADLFFLDLPIDAAGLTTLVGLPSAEQRARARRVEAQMYDLASQAELLIEDAILNMEATPGYATNAALQAQRRRMDETQRQRRIPFLHGVGACLAAEFNASDETQRRHLYVVTVQLLSPLTEELEGAPATQARLYCGLAQARLGDFDAAENMFRAVATPTDADPTDVFAARMFGVINRTIRGGVDAGLEALSSVEKNYADEGDLFHRVLLADARYLLHRRRAMEQSDASARATKLIEATTGYVSALNGLRESGRQALPAAGSGGAQANVLRAIVLAKLMAAADNEPQPLPLEKLPALVSVAAASRLAQDEATAAQGIDLFEHLLARTDLDQPTRATALFNLARAQWSQGQPLEAALRFTQLARDHPTDAQAEKAIELAATIAADEYSKAPGDDRIRHALVDALQLLLERYPNLADINRWRLLAGELALAELRLDVAGRIFAAIPPGDATWLDAQVMLVRLAQMRCEPSSEPDARRRCFEGVLNQIEQARSLIESRSAHAPAGETQPDREHWQLNNLRVAQARTLLELDQPIKAIEALVDLDADPLVDKQLRGEALRLRLLAYQAADRPEDVMRELRRFLQSMQPAGQPGAESRLDEAENVLASLMTTIISEVQSLIEQSRPEQALDRAQHELEPMASVIDDWSAADAAHPGSDVRLRQLVAESYRLSERWDKALAHYERLLKQQPDAAELLFGKAECLFALSGGEPPRTAAVDADRLGQAMIIYKRLAAAGQPPENERFWPAQLRMLQILDVTGRNTQQIVPQIKRLRLQDPNLGGERFRRRFDALQNTYANR